MDLSFESLFSSEEPPAQTEVAPPAPAPNAVPDVEPVNDVTVPEQLLSQAAPVEVDPAGAKAAVDAIIKADGLFSTDKEAVMGALRDEIAVSSVTQSCVPAGTLVCWYPP